MMKPVLALLLGVFVISCSRENRIDTSLNSANIDSLSAAKTDSLHSDITCPKCGFKKTELLPTEVCQLKYTCQSCRFEMTPKEGDCCVFCTYGTVKCPSKQ